jgi:hypothetical protein
VVEGGPHEKRDRHPATLIRQCHLVRVGIPREPFRDFDATITALDLDPFAVAQSLQFACHVGSFLLGSGGHHARVHRRIAVRLSRFTAAR